MSVRSKGGPKAVTVGADGYERPEVLVAGSLPGTAATSLGKAEDAVHASGDVGVMSLGVRKDSPAALAGTDGDYQPPISNAFGQTYVDGGVFADNGATFSRPNDTTAYAVGDLVANSVTAGSVVPMSFTVTRVAAGAAMIRRVRFKKSGTTITNAQFRLHLYKVSPTPSNGDNGAWLTTESTYLGSVDFDLTGGNARVFTDAAKVIGVPAVGSEIIFALTSGQVIYGLIEARAAYTPAANETFTVVLELAQL